MTAGDWVSRLRWIDQVVSVVWIGLITLVLVAGVEIYNSGERGARFWLLAFVVVATVTYPLYTKGYDLRLAVPANLGYLGLVVLAIVVYSGSHAKAAWCLIPTVLWVSTATLYCLAQVRAEGLTP